MFTMTYTMTWTDDMVGVPQLEKVVGTLARVSRFWTEAFWAAPLFLKSLTDLTAPFLDPFLVTVFFWMSISRMPKSK